MSPAKQSHRIQPTKSACRGRTIPPTTQTTPVPTNSKGVWPTGLSQSTNPWLPPTKKTWRFDMWDWDHQSQAEIEAGWAAIDHISCEDGAASRALQAKFKNQDWTPRTAFSVVPARTGGLWALGSPEALADRIRTLQPLDYLVLATDGAMSKTLRRTNGVWDTVAQIGGGWAIGIAAAGTDAGITGAGRVEWVAAGAVQISTTSWDVKAYSYLAESGGMVGARRALTRTSMLFSDDRYVRRPDVKHFCDSDSIVRSLDIGGPMWWPNLPILGRDA